MKCKIPGECDARGELINRSLGVGVGVGVESFVTFASFCGVNTSSTAGFRLPRLNSLPPNS